MVLVRGPSDAQRALSETWVFGSASFFTDSWATRDLDQNDWQGSYCRFARRLGLSQREIAERLGERAGVKITYKNISKYERDKSVPVYGSRACLCSRCECRDDEIVDDDLDLPSRIKTG
jgi:hypothetical protein